MKKTIIKITASVLLLSGLAFNFVINTSGKSNDNISLLELNKIAMAQSEGGGHLDCCYDPGDSCTDGFTIVQNYDESPWYGCW